jgi:hypothetical protein
MDKITLNIDDLAVETFTTREAQGNADERSTLSCDLPTECPRTVCASAPCVC